MAFYLGVDGGQSSTIAVIGDETGRVAGEGTGGPCNHVGTGEGRAKLMRAVSDSVGRACDRAGLEFATVRFEAACFGMSGGPDDKAAILGEILRTERLEVTDDAVIALVGATAGEPGIITIAGTGSIAFGRNADGRTARAGGWGYIFGDEGGGFDIVRQSLRAALRYEEGWGPPTALHSALLEKAGVESANHLLHRFYTDEWPRARVAQLARLIDEVALAGDAVAREILLSAGQQLAALAGSVRRQLWREDESALVAYIGGAFGSRLLLERFCTLLELAGDRSIAPAYTPAAGALLEAYRVAGLKPTLSLSRDSS